MPDVMHEAVRVRDFNVLMRNYDYQLDASDLGLAPGQWPRAIVANRMLWQLQSFSVNLDQEVVFAEYRAEGYLGEYRLTVIND